MPRRIVAQVQRKISMLFQMSYLMKADDSDPDVVCQQVRFDEL